MDVCCAATQRVRCGGGPVSIEDALTLGMKPDTRPIVDSALPRINTPLSQGEALDWYLPGPRKYAEMTKVSPLTIVRGGLTRWPYVTEALHAQRGQVDYAVAALCIWICSDTGQYVCERLPLHCVPLDKWVSIVKPFADECRRLGQVFGNGKAEIAHAFKMRKLVALCGRTDEEADWEKEHQERTGYGNAKFACRDGRVSSDAYRYIREKVIGKVVKAAMPALISRGGSLDEYFEQRWWQTPRGTTSKAGDTKRQLKGMDERLDLQLRPIKPTVMELETYASMRAQFRVVPHCVARGSTKPEPGMKRRALLAVDDRTAFIAGYASANIEISTKEGGMVLRQDPQDVSEWVSFDIGPKVWRVSNDFSNFNILNSQRSMQLIDLGFAAAWDKVAEPWARDKAIACRWVAASHMHSFMRTPLGTARTANGLWSGHRNTARDNTILHLVYLTCIQSVLKELFGVFFDTSKQRVCGDDETVSYTHWAVATLHTLVADALGYTSQVTKGLLSTCYDEFLQLMRSPGNLPTYPVAHTILTFCSGNWYKDPVRDLTSTIKDVSDHVWDMVLGGLPVNAGQILAYSTLNYLMQVKRDGHLVPLEWYDFRGMGLTTGHPLWRNELTEAPPKVEIVYPSLQVPIHAAQDSTLREQPVWEFLGHHRRKQIVAERGWTSYRNVAKHWLLGQYDQAAVEKWPLRRANTFIPGEAPPPPIPVNRWRAVGERGVERSARVVALKCGFPPELLNTDDMWKAMSMLSARDRSNMYAGLADRQKATSGWRYYVPPLLRVI